MILAIIVFILIFSFLVLGHELGHFLAARKIGVKVEEFGIGFPPKIWGKKIGETEYTVNWIPFGGFVKILGEDRGEEANKESLSSRGPGQKAFVLLSGVAFNFLIAIIVFGLLVSINGFKTYQSQIFEYEFPFGDQTVYPAINYVVENSPAEGAGIETYDMILAVNGEEVNSAVEFTDLTKANAGNEVLFSILNAQTQEEKELTILLRVDSEEGALGVGVSEISELSYNSLGGKIFAGPLHTANITHLTFSALGHLIQTSVDEGDISPLSDNLTGPVGILAMTQLTLAGGAWQVFYLLAAISLALAIMNILPIPAVDGGRMVFVLYEAIFKRKFPERTEHWINVIGFYALLFLFFLITIKDIVQFKDILIK
jgi:regulator of sigma E protease